MLLATRTCKNCSQEIDFGKHDCDTVLIDNTVSILMNLINDSYKYSPKLIDSLNELKDGNPRVTVLNLAVAAIFQEIRSMHDLDYFGLKTLIYECIEKIRNKEPLN